MARQISRSAALAVLMITGSAASVVAQPRMARGPNPDAPRLMVSACRTTDKVLAVQCADKIRTEVEGDISFRVLYVSPKTDVENTLTASGYDPAVALAPADAVALAKNIRADMYIDATVDKTATGYRITAAAVLARDANLSQPLGTFEGAKLDDAVKKVSGAYTEAFEKSFQDQKECFTLARERKTADAQRRVDAVLKNYPKSSWIRFCQLGLLTDAKAPIAQTLKVLEELVAADPANKTALRQLVIAYDQTGDKEKKVATLEKMLAADPTDARLLADIINELAGMGQFDKALPIAEKGVAMHQGNLDIIRPYWLILNAKSQNKTAMDVGKQMVAMDTAAADSTYFMKQIAAANADSNFAAAAEFADQGGIKFPKGPFNGYAAGFWRRAGNTEKSLAASRRALAANPNAAGMRATIATSLLQETPPKVDAAIAIIKEMITANEDKAQIAGLALGAGDALRKAAEELTSKGGEAAAVMAANERAYATIAWADTLAAGTTPQIQGSAKFLLGVSAMSIGRGHLTEASGIITRVINEVRAMKPTPDAARQKAILDPEYAKACVLNEKANEYLSIAQLAVPQGARGNPQAAQQVMAIMAQLNGSVEQIKKNYCTKK